MPICAETDDGRDIDHIDEVLAGRDSIQTMHARIGVHPCISDAPHGRSSLSDRRPYLERNQRRTETKRTLLYTWVEK